MGARISKEPIELPKGYPGPPEGPANPTDDPFELQLVSQSRFYCFVQQAAVWPDYYACFDLRAQSAYDKAHAVGAKPAVTPDDDLSWAWDMLVLIYSAKHTDPAIKAFVKRLSECESPPKGVYVLEGSFKKFLKRYKFVSHKADTADSLPGPVELVPPTPTHPGTYTIHRVHFLRAKSIIARLYCSTIINVSSRRLFVKTAGINLENTSFDDNPTPEDFVVTVYMKYAGQKPKKKGRNNILIIDESGCDYGSILAGWHLIKHRKQKTDDSVAAVTARTGFLDTWYADVLTDWAQGEK